jgi:hypothetical protein
MSSQVQVLIKNNALCIEQRPTAQFMERLFMLMAWLKPLQFFKKICCAPHLKFEALGTFYFSTV